MENGSELKMSSESVDDLALIENETFDFDLPVSPQECHGGQLIDLEETDEIEDDEDEVFIGPVGFKEKCVATNADLTVAEQKPMSPPTAEQYASLFKEAMSLSLELQRNSSKSDSSSSSSSASDSSVTRAGGRKSSIAPALDSIQESSCAVNIVTDGGEKAHCEAGGDAKSELERFKRQVKKDIRSPARRGTFTIATNQPSPYPTMEEPECTKTEPKKDPPSTKLLQPRPPAQGVVPRGRGSMLPTRGLRRPTPVSTGKGEEIVAHNGKAKTGTTNPEGVTKIPQSGIQKPAVRRLVNPKVSGLKKPGIVSGIKPTNNEDTESKKDSVPATKLPSKKMGLIKPSAISRPHRNGTAIPSASKPQPMKATLSFGASSGATVNGKGLAKKTTTTSQVPTNGKRKVPVPSAATPSTPVFQEKKVIPKRLLGSSAGGNTTPAKGAVTPRRSSISSLPRPSTPVQPSTPHTRHTSISVPPSSAGPGSARRRSCIPTPNRRASTSTRPASRLAAPTAVSRPQSAQPAQKETSRFSPLLLSPLQTPPQFKLSPDGPEEKVTKPSQAFDDSTAPPSNVTGSSPEFSTSITTKTPNPDNVLRTRTNLQETVKESSPILKVATPKDKPSVGMLIDFGSATPKDKKGVKTSAQLGRAAIKENLINL